MAGGIGWSHVSAIQNPQSFPAQNRRAEVSSEATFAACQRSFTSAGHLIAEFDNAKESFGGDICTQLIGTTICVLSHECEILTAARLFNRFLLPYLFGQASPVTDALQSQIMEMSNLQKIVNEGPSRGWPNKFLDTIRGRELPEANQGWRYTTLNRSDPDYDDFGGETDMIAGLLKGSPKTKYKSIAHEAAVLLGLLVA